MEMTAPFYLRVSNQSCYKYVITNDMCTKTSSYLYGNLLPTKMAACSILVLAWPYIHPHKAIIIKYGVWSDFNIKPECLMFAKRRILSTSNRIPTRGSCKKCCHVYFLLQDFWVILLFCQIVLLSDINVVLMSQ